MKLMLVPLAKSTSTKAGLQLPLKQKTKQSIFTDMMAKSFAMNFEILNLDSSIYNLPSLQSLLMSIKSKECSEQTLFASVDTYFKNENQVLFSFIPKVQY